MVVKSTLPAAGKGEYFFKLSNGVGVGVSVNSRNFVFVIAELFELLVQFAD